MTDSRKRTEAEINEGRYGLGHLPLEVRRWIVTEATKIAGWESPTVKGENGSTMMMEWLTFAVTKERWIDDIRRNIGQELPVPLQDLLLKASC